MDSYVFISGASGGLGRAYVNDAAERGWNLFLTDIPGSPLSDLAEKIRSRYGVKVMFEEGSFLTPASRDEFFTKLTALNLKFNFLINVAGVEFETPFNALSLDQIRLIMNVNMNGTVELTSTVLELRDRDQAFRILTVSSLSYFYPMPYKAAYSSTKRFLYHFFTTIREELRSENVTVTLLCPAGMPTKQVVMDRIAAQGFMGRLTTKAPDYVAHHSIEKALKGKEEYIPGTVNRFLRLAGSILSDPAKARMLKRRWDRAAV